MSSNRQHGAHVRGATVLRELSNGIATITLNRPERLNAINFALIGDLRSSLQELMADPAALVIILTGSGDRAFCSGDDLDEMEEMATADIGDHVEFIQDITRLLMFGEKPVIAAVNGWAVGGGFEWVIGCDFSIWAETAHAFTPEVSLGMGVTGAATALLPKLIGWQRAKAVLLLGDKISARELVQFGIAHAVVPPEGLMPAAMALANRLSAMPASAVKGLRQTIAQVHRAEIELALDCEARTMVELLRDERNRARIADFWKTRR